MYVSEPQSKLSSNEFSICCLGAAIARMKRKNEALINEIHMELLICEIHSVSIKYLDSCTSSKGERTLKLEAVFGIQEILVNFSLIFSMSYTYVTGTLSYH